LSRKAEESRKLYKAGETRRRRRDVADG